MSATAPRKAPSTTRPSRDRMLGNFMEKLGRDAAARGDQKTADRRQHAALSLDAAAVRDFGVMRERLLGLTRPLANARKRALVSKARASKAPRTRDTRGRNAPSRNGNARRGAHKRPAGQSKRQPAAQEDPPPPPLEAARPCRCDHPVLVADEWFPAWGRCLWCGRDPRVAS